MGFAEALSDDGSLTGRGHPWVRGLICGLMTALGGIGHTLPFLIPDFHAAMAAAVVVVRRTGPDLRGFATATWKRRRLPPPCSRGSALGGVLVFLTGILIGSSRGWAT